MSDLLTIILVRYNSDRLPGKAIADINGKPLLWWLINRLKHPRTGLPGDLVVATTNLPDDDKIEIVARNAGAKVYRYDGDTNDVVSRVNEVVSASPNTRYIFRALGDCPFVATELVRRSHHALKTNPDYENFLWFLEPNQWPIYGAREFVMSRSAWRKINSNARGEEREHVDMWFNHNRERFNIMYHDPPGREYFRHPELMRLEVDWPEDIELVRKVAIDGPGMLAPMSDIVRWLDKNKQIAQINSHLSEKTGPIASYDHEMHRRWFKLMSEQPVYTWNNQWREPFVKNRSSQIHCSCGELLGYGWNGNFYYKDNWRMVIKEGYIPCVCGTGVDWQKRIERRR